MSYRSEKFNGAMSSLDTFIGRFEDPSKIAALSDRGKSVRRMLDEVEPPTDDSPDHDQELAGAVLRLVVSGKEHLVETLLLIAENGDNREESFGKMPRATYFRHRDMLLDFFK